MINPLHKVEINSYIYHHPRVTEALDGFTIAQVSDVHMGRWLKASHLRHVLEVVDARRPDVVALTGDYIGYSKKDIGPCVSTMGLLQTPSFAVLGNHDHWGDTQKFLDAFARTDIALLNNARVRFERDGAPLLEIVGVDDAVTKHADPDAAFDGVDPELFCLVLNHVPSISDTLTPYGGHLFLSGHTHGFQFNVPRLTHGIAESFGTKYFAGAYHLDGDAYLYINRGLGSASWPRRLRALPELTFFELRQGDEALLELHRTEFFRATHGNR